MNVVMYTFKYKSREEGIFKPIPIGDIHIGSRGFDEKRFYKTLDYAKEHESPIIGMGDYCEFIGKNDPRHDYSGVNLKYLTPDKQYKRIRDDLSELKKQIICILAGNHEATYWMHNGIDWANWLAAELGVPYCPDFAYIRVRFHRDVGEKGERHNLNILAHHGWTNARTDGYKIKTIHDMRNVFPECHVYLMGHVHRLGEALPTNFLWVDDPGNTREFVQRYFFTGSYVKNYETGDPRDGDLFPFTNYAARRGYPPTMLGSPILHIRPNRTEKVKGRTPFDIKYETMEWIGEP